ncbi:MAG: hypothetical protein WD557_17405 [Dehalococcoidia bacterium]
MADDERPNRLEVARRHLQRVLAAWDEPTDWDDLSLYGFYCLEAAIMAASDFLGWDTKAQHTDKARAARRLHDERGLPDVEDLLGEMNQARKATAYGDMEIPELHAEDVASEIEAFVEAVAHLIEARE